MLNELKEQSPQIILYESISSKKKFVWKKYVFKIDKTKYSKNDDYNKEKEINFKEKFHEYVILKMYLNELKINEKPLRFLKITFDNSEMNICGILFEIIKEKIESVPTPINQIGRAHV